jgi:NDP-sugar pyrophosphorylase family protein
MNGDSFCKVDFNALYNFHLNKKAVASVVVTPGRQDTDYGVIKVDSKRKIIAFNEKDKNPKRFYLNAGMYIFQRKIFNLMPPAGSFSIERDFFPEIVDNKFYAYVTREGFIDIGTPVRYRGAQKFLKKQGESKA